MANKVTILLILIILIIGCLVGYPLYTNIMSVINQQAAREAIMQICKAEKVFKEKPDKNHYGTLAELGVAGLISEDVSKGVYKGFKYEIKLNANSYIVLAVPIKKSISGYWGTGLYSICVDESCNACENFVEQ